MNSYRLRINLIRSLLKKHGLDAYYISGTDPHGSEYLSHHWRTREFISGFTGSFGQIIITKKEAGLWTDTRYFLQAENQLQGTGIKLHKLRVPGAVLPEIWLSQNLKKGSKVGIHPQSVSTVQFRNLKQSLDNKGIELVLSPDFLDSIWKNRPELPSNPIFELPVKYAGLSRTEKFELIESELQSKKADFHIITTLDELAWTFNLRGSDVDYNPVFMGYGIVGKGKRILFIHPEKINSELKADLSKENIILTDYSRFYNWLSKVQNKTIFTDPSTANYGVINALHEKNIVVEGTSVISLLKSKKNRTELSGFRNAMRKDGVALVEFLYWLNQNLEKQTITEFDAGRKLNEFRSHQEGHKGESFTPIVGYKHHGAIVHLSVNADNALELKPEGILLFDSGGQYLDGTTDITRTIALGKVTEQQKTDFTLVLKGMIALSNVTFPAGTLGCHLDILARKTLWDNGLNYGHGTGHGVGHFLNVHEGPMSIRQEFNPIPIEPGNVLSNEPALYREGQYGIRTENMMVCVEKETTPFGKFLGFETLSLCPIDSTLIVKELLSFEEINWINEYHKRVYSELLPVIKKEFAGFLDVLTRSI